MDQNPNNSVENPINLENIAGDDEIDLREVFKSIKRNKKIVFIFFFLSVLISSILMIKTKRTYMGEFQIVLEKDIPLMQSKRKNMDIVNLALGRNNKLKTEVGILKSPSVLMNIFDFVKKEKLLRDDNSYSKMRFKSWRDTFVDIKLQKGTSILNLSYIDTDKDLILPVLTKISNAYQTYSGEKRLREIELGINFFNDQILFYKNKIADSQKEMEEFGDKYNLSIIENKKLDDDFYPIINVEAMQEQINILDQEIALLRTIYSENDRNIINTIRKRNSLKVASNRPPGAVIEYKQLINEVERDKKTLIELENNLRLVSLEQARYKDPWRLLTKPTLFPNPIAPLRRRFVSIGGFIGLFIGSLIALQYEKSKGIIFSSSEIKSLLSLPIITEIQLKKSNSFTETFAENIFLSIKQLSLLKSKKFKFITENTIMIELFRMLENKLNEYKVNQKHLKEDSSWSETLYLILNNIIANKEGKIGIFITSEIEKSLIHKIKKELKEFIDKDEILITKNIKDTDLCVNSILLTSLGMTKKISLVEFQNRTLFKQNSFIGILVLNSL